jgi:hypothetical protein
MLASRRRIQARRLYNVTFPSTTFAMYRPSLRNCITFLLERANCAHREFVSGFCSSPRIWFPSKMKSTCRRAALLRKLDSDRNSGLLEHVANELATRLPDYAAGLSPRVLEAFDPPEICGVLAGKRKFV